MLKNDFVIVAVQPTPQQILGDKQTDYATLEQHLAFAQFMIHFVNQQKNAEHHQANHKNIEI